MLSLGDDCCAAILDSSGSRSMPIISPVLSVTASGASTVFVRRMIMPRWIMAILGSLPVAFMFGMEASCSYIYIYICVCQVWILREIEHEILGGHNKECSGRLHC